MKERNLYLPALALVALALLTGAATATEHRVTNATVDQIYSTVLDDRILWSDNRTGDYDVYLYTLTGETEETLSPPESDQFATALPAGMGMSGDRVVWEDNQSGNRDIYTWIPDEAAQPGQQPARTPAPSAPLTPASPGTPGVPGTTTQPTATPTPEATVTMPPDDLTETLTPIRTLPPVTFPTVTFVTLEPTQTPFLL